MPNIFLYLIYYRKEVIELINNIMILDKKYPRLFNSKAQYLNVRQIESLNSGIGSAIANGVDLDICRALFINNASTYRI